MGVRGGGTYGSEGRRDIPMPCTDLSFMQSTCKFGL